ncbi:MAG: DoxX family protein [Lacipirellulaceae bacterium]
MNETSSCCRGDDIGKLVLRLSLGLLMLLHGIGKLRQGVEPIVGMLAAWGLPAFVAQGVFLGELVAPVLMIVGLCTRPAAAVYAFTMVSAIALAHPTGVLALNGYGAWEVELPGLYGLCALALVLMGPGGLSLDAMWLGKWRGAKGEASSEK